MNWKKGLIPTLLAMSIVLPAGVYAAASESNAEQTDPSSEQRMEMKHHGFMKGFFAKGESSEGMQCPGGPGSHGGKKMGAHPPVDFLPIVEQYAPEQVEEWKQVLAELEELRDEMKSMRDQHHEEMMEQMQELKEKVKSGEMTREQAKEQMMEWRTKHHESQQGGMHSEKPHENHKQLMEALKDAVESGDEAAIKEKLPQILEEMKQHIEEMKSKLSA